MRAQNMSHPVRFQEFAHKAQTCSRRHYGTSEVIFQSLFHRIGVRQNKVGHGPFVWYFSEAVDDLAWSIGKLAYQVELTTVYFVVRVSDDRY